MSIFNNYDKPGKGVEKNKPKKLPIVIFFETAVRKYWKFIQSGVLFTLFSIPWLIFLYIGSYFILYMPISSIIRDMDPTQASLMASMICATLSFLLGKRTFECGIFVCNAFVCI